MKEKNIGREQGRKRMLSANYTVEASLIFSVLLLILVTILSTTEFLTDSVRMSAILAERAQVLAEDKEAKPVEAVHFFRLNAKKIRQNIAAKRVEVSCRDKPKDSRFGEEYHAVFVVKKRRPAAWLRRVRLLQALSD